ncbi:hypothetical protein TCAL_03608 [Tigriopus californicus]|uniref:Protein-tyrosine-phosphatase n=1 Tax=Tigriopus californicus TaxID=6832 RepID=A0A553NBK5_TIGCA|nr:receptor-type tyrosine-protein phosphatase eta-like [Tigriopus californicus]TRY62797.1 hypothetical protein TCAL_03608 [Tigriopus californicus]|eukprot:TCALIF_03608-PA protein Name:"Similar to Ptprj Receptor-type tyrosine-protein phosphatase eta (Mus musculus)" AED:0.04 eAED:0.04 QI:154/1/1/1/1/1/7/129/504
MRDRPEVKAFACLMLGIFACLLFHFKFSQNNQLKGVVIVSRFTTKKYGLSSAHNIKDSTNEPEHTHFSPHLGNLSPTPWGVFEDSLTDDNKTTLHPSSTSSEGNETTTTTSDGNTFTTTANEGFSTTSEKPIEPPPEESNLIAILLGTFIPLVVLIIVGFILFRVWKHKKPKVKLANKVSQYERRLSCHPMSVREFNSQFHIRLRDGDVNKEFELLQEYGNSLQMRRPRNIGQMDINKPKNRFVDIIPYDHSLVRSTVPDFYINASVITGPHLDDYFIAAQGPKRNTCVDFWNMVLEQKVEVIVCLTNIIENDRVKCFEYWPNDGEMLHFDELSLYTTSEVSLQNDVGVIRTIEVTKEEEDSKVDPITYRVTQYHMTSWPDHGVPESTSAVLQMCSSLMQFKNGERSKPEKLLPEGRISGQRTNPPIVVHCSAGVGRTGTFIGVLMVLRQIEICHSSEVDIASLVKSMRDQRPKMVQSFDQYIFIYHCVKDFINQKTGLVEMSV